MNDNDLWKTSENEVMSLGISVSCKGFYYLVYAVVYSLELGLKKVELCKDIYQRIACINHVSAGSVEKCIRNCIIRAWNENEEAFVNIFGFDSRKPTNSEVIACISSRIRLERRIEI